MKNHIYIFLRGLVIGAVEIIPGVSGGTMALILGIYEKLVVSISKIDLIFIKKLAKGKFKQAWVYANCDFLSVLSAWRVFLWYFFAFEVLEKLFFGPHNRFHLH